MFKKFILAMLVVLMVAAPAMAMQPIKASIKTGGYLSSSSLGIPGAEDTSFSSPDGSQAVPPIEVELNFNISVDWLSASVLAGTYKGSFDSIGGEIDARSVYGMVMPRLEMGPTNLGDVFSWIPGLSKEDDVPEPGDVITPVPPVFDPRSDFDPAKRVNAYIGCGVGAMWNNLMLPNSDTDEFAFAYAPSVGASWGFNDMLEMTFDYRWMNSGSDKLTNQKGHLFLVGLGYTFE